MLDGPTLKFNYGAACGACIDATVGNIAVEVEARVPKQVRGAMMDLVSHPYPNKLLLLLPVPSMNLSVTIGLANNIMERYCPENSFLAIALGGTGDNHQLATDVAIVSDALRELGWRGAA